MSMNSDRSSYSYPTSLTSVLSLSECIFENETPEGDVSFEIKRGMDKFEFLFKREVNASLFTPSVRVDSVQILAFEANLARLIVQNSDLV